MILNGKYVNLETLQDEIVTAGHTIRGLGQSGDVLHTYNIEGSPIDIPPGAYAVVQAHVPPPFPPTPDYGGDGVTRDQFANAVSQLRAFIANPAPTNAQAIANAKLQNRAILFLAKELLR